MPEQQNNRPNLDDVAKKFEQLATQTPPEVVKRMKQRLEKKRFSTASVSGELLTKRLG